MLTAQEHLDKARWHMEQAQGLLYEQAEQREDKLRHEPESMLNNDSDKGWVTDYQCGDTPGLAARQGRIGPSPHGPHRYGRHNGQWCDGFI